MIARRSLDIPPFLVMEILERAQALERSGARIIHMEIGEPDFVTPPLIKKTAIEAIERGETHYTHSLGIWPLREAVADWTSRQYGVRIQPERVVVTMGTSPGLLLALCALVNPGDEVILTDPGYACYPNFVRYIGGTPVFVPLRSESGFVPAVREIRAKISRRTRAILINSPANPTGAIVDAETLAEIVDLGPTVISDEIYHGLVYGDPAHSVLEFSDRAIVLNGFSKRFAMTGWRLGYLILPPEYVRPVQKSQQNLFICASSVAQWAGIAALNGEHPELAAMLATYRERRDYMLSELREIGFTVEPEPAGAFYILADARAFDHDSVRLANRLLDEAGVAVAPGIDFGSNAEGYLRFSYANSIENIREGMVRLRRAINGASDEPEPGSA